MRESGFDPTGRFGPFGADVTRYAPVCLNTLLYRMERDLAEIDQTLGSAADAGAGAGRSAQGGADRNAAVGRRRRALLRLRLRARPAAPYPFATTFWPLWAGVASPAHARRVRDNLRLFERPGGIVTSTTVTGAQWDAPFGWAPLQLFAVERPAPLRLRRRRRSDRARLAVDAGRGFERRGTLVEKYDVERRTSDVAGRLAFGYTEQRDRLRLDQRRRARAARRPERKGRRREERRGEEGSAYREYVISSVEMSVRMSASRRTRRS